MAKKQSKKTTTKKSSQTAKSKTSPKKATKSTSKVTKKTTTKSKSPSKAKLSKSKTSAKPTKNVQVTEKQTPKISKAFVIAALALAVLLGLIYFLRKQLIVATVNGQPVYRITLVKELERQAGRQTLEGLVTKALILQEARKQKVEISDEEVQAEMKKLEDTFSAQGQDFDELMEMQGVTRKEVEEQFRIQKMVEAMAGKEIVVSDEEVDKYLEENAEYLPEDFDEAELRETVRTQIKQQKLTDSVETWLQGLQKEAVIKHYLFEEQPGLVVGQ